MSLSALAASDVVKQVINITGGVDCAIECVGNISTMQDAFYMIRDGGRAVVVGLPTYTDKLDIPAIMLLRERKLTGSIYGSASPHRDFARFAADGVHRILEQILKHPAHELGVQRHRWQFIPAIDADLMFAKLRSALAKIGDGLLQH